MRFVESTFGNSWCRLLLTTDLDDEQKEAKQSPTLPRTSGSLKMKW